MGLVALSATILVAVALWAASLRDIELARMTDVGLVSVLPPAFLGGLFLLNAGFVLTLRMRPLPRALLLIDVMVLVLMLYGVTSLVEGVPRVSITWLHAGFAELIDRTGQLSGLDARFDWPLFFVAAAFVTSIAGLESPVALAQWISFLLNLAYLGPLLLIFTSATSDRRLVWLAIWVFYLTNWVGQDYFSPQGFNFLLYLALLAILLRSFRPRPASGGWLDRVSQRFRRLLLSRQVGTAAGISGEPEAELASTPAQRIGLVALALVLFAAIVASHQLTPFAALAAVAALVLFNRCSLRGLPLVMAMMIATWISYMTVAYLSGHLAGILAGVGQADTVAQASVAARVSGSDEHLIVIYVRLALSLGVWLLAAFGILRRLRSGQWDLSFVLLATAPFFMMWLHGYGGELLLRIFFLSLPFMSFFVAAVIYPNLSRVRFATSAGAAALAALLLVGFLFARYGNERADMMTAGEVEAVATLYEQIEPGALIVTANYNSPIGYRDFDLHQYLHVRDEVLTGDVAGIRRAMQTGEGAESYLVLTRSQQATAEMFSGLQPGSWERLIDRLRRAPAFETVLSTPDAVVFTLGGEGG